MTGSADEPRDLLGLQAESYEQGVATGSAADTSFESDHPGLAKTLRLLNTVFPTSGEDPTKSLNGAVNQDTDPLTQIGRFQVIRRLGSGSFGSVWLATDPVLKRQVAVKVAHVGRHAAPDLLERFAREAHLAARLHHPNIVPVFEAGEDDGRLFIVSEFCAGPTLEEWLNLQTGRVDPTSAAVIVRHLADAAQHAHQQGLIHRDIKPGNVLLSDEGASADEPGFVPRLTDFGLARDLTAETTTTRTGMMVGTARYMSPEQAAGKSELHGPSSDVYSLGVLLYRMLSGTVPFNAKSEFEIIQQIVSSEPTQPTRIAAEIPRDLNSICLKCLEKQPERRYANGGGLRDDLDRFLRGDSTIARPIRAPERMIRWARRTPALAGLILVSVAALVIAVAGLSFHVRKVEQNAEDLAIALDVAHDEREAARNARDDEKSARKVADVERQFARQTSYRSDVRLAFELLKRGQSDNVERLLANQLPGNDVDLRGPEWFVLKSDLEARSRLIGTHNGSATECVLSRDRKTAYTSGTDGFVKTWDLDAGTEVRSFHAKIGAVHALALSPDGSTIAVGGEALLINAEVRLIDAVSGEVRSCLQSHETTIESIEFSPDGRWLAAGSRYQPVQLTRLAGGKTFSLPSERRNRTLSFSSDSLTLAVGATTRRVDVVPVDGDEPGPAHEVLGYADGNPYIVQFAPNSSLLATGYVHQNFISLFDQPGNVRRALAMEGTAHSRSARFKSLGFSPTAQYLAAGDEAGSIVFWTLGLEAGDGRRLQPSASFTPHEATVSAVEFADESNLISAGEDGRVCLTSPSASGVSHIRWPEIVVTDAVVSGKEMLLACEDGTVRRQSCDLADGKAHAGFLATPKTLIDKTVPDVFFGGFAAVECLAVSPDGHVIAVGTQQGGVRLHQRDTGDLIRHVTDDIPEADVSVHAIAFSANGKLLAVTGNNGFVTVYDIETERERFQHFVGNGYALSFFDEDNQLAVSFGSERLDILKVETGEIVRSIVGVGANGLQLSPDKQTLVCAQQDGRFRIIDVRSGAEKIVSGRGRSVESIAFASGGRSVMTFDWEGNVVFSDIESGSVFGSLLLPDKVVYKADHSTILCTDLWLAAIRSARNGADVAPGTDLYFWRLGSDGRADVPAGVESGSTTNGSNF